MPKTLKSFCKDLCFALIPITVIAVLAYFGTSVRAGDNYSADISDLPVFEGLTVKEELNTVFDSPEGRVVDVYMEGAAEKADAAYDFYASTLPELGWKKRGTASYERGDEQLNMSSEKSAGTVTLKFSIRPKGE
jgi:hypothetical protein